MVAKPPLTAGGEASRGIDALDASNTWASYGLITQAGEAA
jgi:hypothetical protein